MEINEPINSLLKDFYRVFQCRFARNHPKNFANQLHYFLTLSILAKLSVFRFYFHRESLFLALTLSSGEGVKWQTLTGPLESPISGPLRGTWAVLIVLACGGKISLQKIMSWREQMSISLICWAFTEGWWWNLVIRTLVNVFLVWFVS